MAWSVLDWRKSPGKSASQPRNNFDRCKGRPYDCAPMSSTPLPKQVDIRKLIAVDTTLSAREPLGKFERLADMLMSTDGDVDVHLHLYRDKQGIKRIDGEVKAQLQVQCQRCMQSLTLPVDSIFAVAVVWSDDEASRLPKEVEPYIVGEGLQDVRDLIEDELILSVPYASYHDIDQCSVTYKPAEPEAPNVAEAKPNPFQVLEQLKSGK